MAEKAKWTPAVSLNIEEAGGRDLEPVLERFREWSAAHPPIPHGLTDGWHEITPPTAENLLQRNPAGANRKVSLSTVQYYAHQMKNGTWQRTGQPIIISDQDILLDAQHRLLAGYLSNTPFWSYVVTKVPHIKNIFAFIDNGKVRSLTDALQTAGLNGVASKVAGAVKIARGYAANAYHVEQADSRMLRATPIDVLEFVMANPKLPMAAHMQLTEYDAANELISHDATAVFVAWKISDIYGDEILAEFMEELGDEDSESTAITQLRKKLLADISTEKPMRKSLKLGFITKAFNAWRMKQVMTRLNLKTDEAWPRFEDEVIEADEAA